ncbi:unnamed protein product [Alopecurus aequalis]
MEVGDAPSSQLLLNLEIETSSTDILESTTASCKTSGGDGHVQVKLYAAQPPRISSLRVCCSGSLSASEPYIVATGFNIILLAVALRKGKPRYKYLVYRLAPAKAASSLEFLPDLVSSSISLDDSNTGILICPGNHYLVAALLYTSSPGEYNLHLYSSKTRDWIRKPTMFYENQKHMRYFHSNNKVITVGGQAGTMAWVDLWHGILLCDVLSDDSELRYITLPPPLLPDNELQGCPRSTRDIAFVSGRINYLEVKSSLRPTGKQNYISDGWTAAKWSISPGENTWQDDFRFEASKISVKDQLEDYRLLPELRDDDGKAQKPLVRLHTGHPTLSLKEVHVVYLMAKENYMDEKAWVLAIDMRNKSLQGVAEFTADRVPGFCYTYTHLRVSEI